MTQNLCDSSRNGGGTWGQKCQKKKEELQRSTHGFRRTLRGVPDLKNQFLDWCPYFVSLGGRREGREAGRYPSPVFRPVPASSWGWSPGSVFGSAPCSGEPYEPMGLGRRGGGLPSFRAHGHPSLVALVPEAHRCNTPVIRARV